MLTNVETRVEQIRPRILCAVDFTPQNRAAFAWAVRLARLSDADLLLVHAVSRSEPFSRNALARIRGFAAYREEARARGVPVSVSVQHGSAAGVIALHATSRGAQLIVLGTNGRSGWKRFKAPSVAEEVVRRASVPVFVVPRNTFPSDTESPGHILCAVDFSPASDAALAEALRLAGAQGNPLTVLHVVGGRGYFTKTWAARFRGDGETRLLKEAARRVHERLPLGNAAGAAVNVRVAAGAADRNILRVASDLDVSMILVGASQRRLGGRLRSTVSRVVREAKVPVLVVPRMSADAFVQRPEARRVAA